MLPITCIREITMQFCTLYTYLKWHSKKLIHTLLGLDSNVWGLTAWALHCMENTCTQSVVSLLDHTLCISPTFSWVYGYWTMFFHKMHNICIGGNEIRWCNCENNHKHVYWRVSLCYGEKHFGILNVIMRVMLFDWVFKLEC